MLIVKDGIEYNIPEHDGVVSVLFAAGDDRVLSGCTVASAYGIIGDGTLTVTDGDYPLCIDQKWYFPGDAIGNAPVYAPNTTESR